MTNMKHLSGRSCEPHARTAAAPLPAGLNCLSAVLLMLHAVCPLCYPPTPHPGLSFRPGVISLYPPHVSLPQTGALGPVLWVMWPSVLQQLSPVLTQKPQVSPQICSTRTQHRGAKRRLKTSSEQQLAVTALSVLSSVSAYTILGPSDTY